MTKFFTSKHVSLASTKSRSELKREYKKSEKELKRVAKTGNETTLSRVMKRHGNIEYAMLYQNTPNFKRKGKKK